MGMHFPVIDQNIAVLIGMNFPVIDPNIAVFIGMHFPIIDPTITVLIKKHFLVIDQNIANLNRKKSTLTRLSFGLQPLKCRYLVSYTMTRDPFSEDHSFNSRS